MIGREARRLLCAVQFLTRIPTPPLKDWEPDWLGRSAKYFPLVGALVGTLCALVFFGARRIWPDGSLPALLAVGVGVLLTGAFHEDGLADTADGLGGGLDKERRLAIMHDSRLGTYGAVALGLGLALKVAALSALPALEGAAALVCAHIGGRAAAVVALAIMPYAGDVDSSKLKPMARDVRSWEAALAGAAAVAALACLMRPWAAGVSAGVGVAAAAWPALAAQKLIGGQTGDVLGAVEQAFETAFLVAAAALLATGLPL